MVKRLRVLPIWLGLAVLPWPLAAVETVVTPELALRQGKDARAFFAAYLEAKRDAAQAPVVALVDAVLWGHEEGLLPPDLSGAAKFAASPVANPSASDAGRDAAVIQSVMGSRGVAAARAALPQFDAIDGMSPYAADAFLSAQQAMAAAKQADDLAGMLAIDQVLNTQLPNTPLAWEARESLIRMLMSQEAYAQAGELAVRSLDSMAQQLERVGAITQRLDAAALGELIVAAELLPAQQRQRVDALLQRRASLQTTERLLNQWLPYMFSFRSKAQKDPTFLVAEARDRVGIQRETLLKPGGTKEQRDQRGLFHYDLSQLVGNPAAQPQAYRLFAGVAQWELGRRLPERWSSEGPGSDVGAALDVAGQLSSLFAAQYPGMLPGERIATDLKAFSDRNGALVSQIRDQLSKIERALKQEVMAGIAARRELVQAWMARYAHHALQVFQKQEGASVEPSFVLTSTPVLKAGTSVWETIQKGRVERREIRPKRMDLSPVSDWMQVLSNGDVPEAVRTDALRLTARISILRREAQLRPSADEAVIIYQRLLREKPEGIVLADARYQLARAQELSRRPADMIETLREFLRQHPSDVRNREASFRIGDAHFAAGDYPQAKSAYESVMAAGDSSFRDPAEFKLAWAQYKMGNHRDALPVFLSVIDRSSGSADRNARDRNKDAFRGMALSFANLEGAAEAERFLTKVGRKQYIPDLQVAVALLYLERDRVQDAATSYATLVRQYPENGRAPELLAAIVRAARRNGLSQLALSQQEEFVSRYGATGAFWRKATPPVRAQIEDDLKPFLGELAALYHADAQQQNKVASRERAIGYYTQLIDAFPTAPELPKIWFMRGEAYTESGKLELALADYDRSASAPVTHDKAAEASYAALVISEKLIAQGKTSEERRQRLRAMVARSAQFGLKFAGDQRVDAVLAKAGEDLLMLGESAETVTLGNNLLARNPSPEIRRRALTMLAHGLFETGTFAPAEAAYKKALAGGGLTADVVRTMRERIAVSIYRQGEAERAAGKQNLASDHFLRIKGEIPESEAALKGQIDGGVALLEQARWAESIAVFERFGREAPGHALTATLPLRLAFAYEKTGRWLDAAEMNEKLSQTGQDEGLSAQQLIRAAELRDKAGRRELAMATYEGYLRRFPEPMERASEVRQLLADDAAKQGDMTRRDRYLNEIVSTQIAAGGRATVRTRYLAASAHLVFGEDKGRQFESVALRLPFEKSLAAKRQAMEQAIRWYDAAVKYGILEITTAATYRMAELYRRLAADVAGSERPSGLKGLEAEQYNELLEEASAPFEDQATKLHEINLGRIATGGYDGWVKRSLMALRAMQPGRYERMEAGESHFAYVPPLAPPRTNAVIESAPREASKKTGGGA